MDKTRLVFLVISGQLLVCWLIWRTIQDSKMTGRAALMFCIAAVVSGFVLMAVSTISKSVIFMAVIGSALAANIANIVYDLFRDPTSHNLFPFELIMTSAISLVGAGIGVGTSAIWRKSKNESGPNR